LCKIVRWVDNPKAWASCVPAAIHVVDVVNKNRDILNGRIAFSLSSVPLLSEVLPTSS